MNKQQAELYAGLIEGELYKVMEKHPMTTRNRTAWSLLLERIGRTVFTLKNVCDSQGKPQKPTNGQVQQNDKDRD
jgi:hypothetical protein